MKRFVGSLPVLTVLIVLLPLARVAAQGVTSAAVVGRVTDDANSAVPSATLTLANPSTGARYGARSAEGGRFFFENVQVGGPYTLEVRALGFEAGRVPDIWLRLGQRLVQDVALKRAAVEVAGVTVTREANPLVSASRTGAQTFVSDSIIRRLPTLSRNFTDFIVTVPQVVTAGVPGATLGGQNNRFNNIQIDGGVNNDVFGLAASGTPGGQANAHPISIEAVREYQVLLAPFDIRQGSFAGGLINAVTKSGTNAFHGSAFGFNQNETFVGKDTAHVKASDFTQSQYGATLSGPIIRDRLHFFASVDVQHREAPFVGQQIGSDPTGGNDSIGVGITPARGAHRPRATRTGTSSVSSPGSSGRTASSRCRTISSPPTRTSSSATQRPPGSATAINCRTAATISAPRRTPAGASGRPRLVTIPTSCSSATNGSGTSASCPTPCR